MSLTKQLLNNVQVLLDDDDPNQIELHVRALMNHLVTAPEIEADVLEVLNNTGRLTVLASFCAACLKYNTPRPKESSF